MKTKTPRRIRHFASPGDIRGHSMYGAWKLPEYEYAFIHIQKLLIFSQGRGTETVRFADICAKPGDWFGSKDFAGPRFERADTRFPGMLVRGMSNPCNLEYRLIDGRRRLQKMKSMGMTEAEYLVFEESEIAPFIYEARMKRAGSSGSLETMGTQAPSG